MLEGWVVVVASFAYLGLLFAIAYYADQRADAGRSVIASPYIYSLSLAVYATAWTFYGSVGRAAANGVGFLPIYIGPTLMIALWWIVMRKILRISKQNRITSLADFIASRYGKSALLGGVVTVIAIIGILPYISLQLKAVSNAFTIVLQYPEIAMPAKLGAAPVLQDTALSVALLLAAFTIVFGTRHLDAAEHHEGMVAAIAFESLVKLVAFVAVGAWVTWGLFDGFGDIFSRAAVGCRAAAAARAPRRRGGRLRELGLAHHPVDARDHVPAAPVPGHGGGEQGRAAPEEGDLDAAALHARHQHLRAAARLRRPAAFRRRHGGRRHFRAHAADGERQELLALIVYIGGLSAATGMVIVETIALSTMACNDLVMPVLLRLRWLRLHEKPDLSGLLLGIRRGAIVLILLLGYVYFRLAGEAYALVSIGLISFAAVAQFAPAALGGIFWKGGTRLGALAGLSAGFAVWLYTLLLPAFARSGWLPLGLLEQGPFGIELLKPLALFGVAGLDQITHAMMWSMAANVGAYVAVSVMFVPGAEEHRQASLFVDVFKQVPEGAQARFWRGTASVPDLYNLLARFMGIDAAAAVLAEHQRERGAPRKPEGLAADAELVHFVEMQLAGVVGAASARILVASVVKEEALSLEEVRTLLDEASQVIVYSHKLEQKSQELERATRELRAANERLQELDRLKDDFVSTVSHELRTPLTSIRAFSEILHDHPGLDAAERSRFLAIIIKETERLTRLINQILDLSRLESGRAAWNESLVDLRQVIEDTVAATSQLFREHGVRIECRSPSPCRGCAPTSTASPRS